MGENQNAAVSASGGLDPISAALNFLGDVASVFGAIKTKKIEQEIFYQQGLFDATPEYFHFLQPTKKDNTMLYVAGGLVLLAGLLAFVIAISRKG